MTTPTLADWSKVYHSLLAVPEDETRRKIMNVVESELRKRGADPVKIRKNSPFAR
jgi:hypothetical protein